MQRLLLSTLSLNTAFFEELRNSPRLVRTGLSVVLFVGLALGLVNGMLGFANTLTAEGALDRAESQVNDFIQQLRQQPNQDTNSILVVDLLEENAGPAFDLLREVQALPTTLPRPAVATVELLRVLFSTPLQQLTGLLLAVLFTHITARWLGGSGNIQHMLGLGALSSVPNLLYMFNFLPGLNLITGMVGWAYGLVVLIVATAVAHRLPTGRATLAVMLFPVLGGLAALLGCCCLLILPVVLAP